MKNNYLFQLTMSSITISYCVSKSYFLCGLREPASQKLDQILVRSLNVQRLKTGDFVSLSLTGDRLVEVYRGLNPNSQSCSNCGNHRHKMPLKNRVYEFPECGYTRDRDLNVARNRECWSEGIYIPESSDLAVSSTPVSFWSRQTLPSSDRS